MKSKHKHKEKSDLLYRLVVLVLLCVIVFSLFQIYLILNKYQVGTKTYTEIAKEVQKDPLDIDWAKLKKKNSDVKAWIYAEDTVINYPIVQGEDNDYYLHRLLNKEYDFKGSIFLDFRVEKPFKDFLTVVYGHAMRDGSMFKPLFKWKEQDWYDEHPTMQIVTKKHIYDVVIFSVKYMKADDEHYNPLVETTAQSDYIAWAQSDSLVETGVTVTEGDKIVMLSTCAEASGDNRVVVYGKLVKRPE